MRWQQIGADMNGTTDVELGCEFTPQEAARLAALYEQYRTRPDYGELGLDIRRLEFARWLVRTGRLSEECVAA